MTAEVLSLRALNRALLSRQLLIDREPLPPPDDRAARAARVLAVIEHLVGLQAQAPFPPYYGLWSRLDGFGPEDLASLITDRTVVRIALMRGTIHLVSARDCLELRRLMEPVLERWFRTTYAKQLAGADLAEVAAAGRALVESEPMTFRQLGDALAARWPDHPPAALAQAIRALVPLVQVPPRAVWGRAGQSLHTSAEHWLSGPGVPVPGGVVPGGAVPDGAAFGGPAAGGRAAGDPAADGETGGLARLVTRYLAAFGPATIRDAQAWSGLTGLRAVMERLRPSLVTFRDQKGAELFDLPSAPRPGGDVPVPVRLTAEFDNLLLAHADRSRVISAGDLKRLYRINGVFPGTVLVDGFVAGMWRLERSRDAATLTIEMFPPVAGEGPVAAEGPVAEEAERMLEFCAPGLRHDIRFAPVTLLAPGGRPRTPRKAATGR